MTSKNWCFTVNNYTGADEVLFKEFDCKYMVYGREVGESGTPHLQGFLVLNGTAVRLSAMKKIHPGAHWEISKGTSEQNRAYCTKDGDYVETGALPMSGKRKGELGGEAEQARWECALAACKEGRWDDIPADIMIRHYGNLKKIRAECQTVPVALSGELINEWIYGPAGSGKSTKALQENPGAYIKGINKWWDQYSGQETVIVEDMDPYHKSLALEFKLWGQHQPFSAETKGGTMVIRPVKIVVTSNYSIDEVWEDPVTREAMHRRYREIYKGPDVPAFAPCFSTRK